MTLKQTIEQIAATSVKISDGVKLAQHSEGVQLAQRALEYFTAAGSQDVELAEVETKE